MRTRKKSKRRLPSEKNRATRARHDGAKKLTAMLFDFGGTLAFLDYDLLAREFSREGRKLEPLALEHAEYAGRAAIDRVLMNPGADVVSSYAEFFRAWMNAAGIPDEEIQAHGARFTAIHREATLWRVVR